MNLEKMKKNKKILRITTAIIAIIAIAGLLITATPTEEEKTPAQTVETYINAMNQANLTQAEQYLTGERAKAAENATEEQKQEVREMMEESTVRIDILEEEIQEDQATVKANWTWIHGEYSETTERTYQLRKEQGKWKIAEIEY